MSSKYLTKIITEIEKLQLSSHTFIKIHILEYPWFYRLLPIRNVNQTISIFFKESCFTHYVTWSVRCLGYEIILNFQDYFFLVNGIGSKTLRVMPWMSQTFEIKSITECCLGSRWQIHFDRNRGILYINLRRSQPPFSLKEHLFLP